MAGAVPTHVLGGFPQDVPDAAAVAQAVVEHGDNAHEQSVTSTFPLLRVSFWGGEQGKDSGHRQGPTPWQWDGSSCSDSDTGAAASWGCPSQHHPGSSHLLCG